MTNNYEWRKNRNLHAICLLDMVLNNRFEEPYNKFPGDGPIPLLSKPNVKSKLSKKFWLYSQYLESQNLLKSEENFSPYDNYNNNIDNIEENNNNKCNYNNINNMNNINNDMEKPNQKNFRMNFRRPKTSDVKLNNKNMNRINNNNNNFNRNYCIENKKLNNKKKNQNQHNQNDIDEINKLNEIILNLQYELNKQDFIINNQIKEKMRLQKRIKELEKVLTNFC